MPKVIQKTKQPPKAEKEPPVPQGLPKDFVGSAGEGECAVTVPGEISVNNSINEIFLFARQANASDVHISINYPIIIRQYQKLKEVSTDKLTKERVQSLLQTTFSQEVLSQFMSEGGAEFVYTIEGGGRYRVTLMKTRSGLNLTARVIPLTILNFEDSGMPESCKNLTKWAQGLVLVAGPACCGKTASLSTLVNMINQERDDHIITIESPVEVTFQPAKCQITQRELDMHTLSQANALKAALRQDPDIIVISELRDLETIRLAVTAAETGHLVFGTMNTLTASQTISNLIDSFPPEEQAIITVMISESLRGIICQQLIPRQDTEGLVAAYEVLMVNTAVANMIREGKLQNITNTIATGKADGMVLLDNSLKDLISKNIISGEDAFARSTNPNDFTQYLEK